MGRIGRWLSQIREFHRSRLLTNLGSLSSEEYQGQVRANFEAGKSLSDFVSMIINFAFLQAAFTYFMRKAPTTQGFDSYVLGICAVAALVLLVVLGGHIFMAIFLYQARDIIRADNRLMKKVVFVLAAGQSFVAWWGIRLLVQEVATRSGV